MKVRQKSFIAFLLAFSIVTGCSSTHSVSNTNKNSKVVPTETVENKKFYSPYTGEEVTKESYNNIAIMAVIENSKPARPQSGLTSADIVFETLAEGGIPRFIALFQKNSCSKVGPIRSARRYFIDISKEYNLPFGHCGGSEEALSMIKNENIKSMNEMANSTYYWRDSDRKAPHNLYTSTEKLRTLAEIKGFVSSPVVKLNFDKNYWENNSFNSANNVLIKINKYYNTSYLFKNGYYYKSMDGTTSLNKEDNSEIKCKNLIIQFTSITLKKDGSHLDIPLTGEGNGYVISDGKYTKMKWVRKDEKSQTMLLDEKGHLIPLSPGNTWWHIIDNDTSVEIK